MKYFALLETAAGSNAYHLGASEIEADSTSDAVAIATKSAEPGCRAGVWPYQAVSGQAAPVTPDETESGKLYNVLAQPNGAAGTFTPDGQTLGSFGADAAGMCLSLQRFFTYRLGLIPTDAQPAAQPTTPPVTSGSGGRVSSGSTPVSSGSTVSSGGTVSGG